MIDSILNGLEPARPSGVCPRRNGVFEHPDPTVCHVMVSCIGGVPTVISCPADLIFDIKTGVCGWPKDIQREGCRRREGCQLSNPSNPL